MLLPISLVRSALIIGSILAGQRGPVSANPLPTIRRAANRTIGGYCYSWKDIDDRHLSFLVSTGDTGQPTSEALGAQLSEPQRGLPAVEEFRVHFGRVESVESVVFQLNLNSSTPENEEAVVHRVEGAIWDATEGEGKVAVKCRA